MFRSIRAVGLSVLACTFVGCSGADSEQPEDASAFCELYEGSDLVAAFRAASSGPSDDSLAAFDEILARYEEVAPSEIADEVSDYHSATRDLLMEGNSVDESSAEYREAQASQLRSGAAVQEYGEAHCF